MIVIIDFIYLKHWNVQLCIHMMLHAQEFFICFRNFKTTHKCGGILKKEKKRKKKGFNSVFSQTIIDHLCAVLLNYNTRVD